MRILFLMLLLFFSVPARAQDMCIDQCLPVPCKKTAEDNCAKPKYTCTKRPCAELYSGAEELGQVNIAPSTSTGYYGAVAIDEKTGVYGFSGRSIDAPTAQSVALQQCHGKCKVVATFANSCFAIARNAKGDASGWGVNDEKGVAKREALQSCIEHSKEESHTCAVKEQRCYTAE